MAENKKIFENKHLTNEQLDLASEPDSFQRGG